MPRPRPAKIVIPASRFIGSLSEEYMSEYSSDTRIHSGFLEFLLQQHGVPIDETKLRLLYSLERDSRFIVSVIASTSDEIDQFYGTIMQVLQPFLLL